jgi:hypothetical protein
VVILATGLVSPFSISPVNGSGSTDDWDIPAGGTQTFTVSFSPNNPGDYSNTLILTSNDADEGSYQIVVQGTGTLNLPPGIISHTPAQNALDIGANSDISVTFDANMAQSSFDANTTFNVDGSISGEHLGAFSGDGTSTITFNPTNDFEVGEVVTVTLTTGLQSSGGAALADDYTFQFVVDAPYGHGQFFDSGNSLGSVSSRDVSLGDLDGDGDLDAFVANGPANKVWLNDGSGNFTDSGQNLGISYPYSYGVSLGDLDGDGDLDAFVANYVQPQANKVWTNDGSGNFTDSGQNLGSEDSYDVSLGDLDGDGDLDAFVANGGLVNKVWLNDGSGTFTDSGQNLGGSGSFGVSLGDVDGDGDLDAFVASYNQANKVWTNDGSGTFTDSGQNLGGSSSWRVSLGDLDGDGDLDAFVANYNQANKVWLNDGSGTFTDSGNSLGSSNSKGVSLGDVDGDGDLDAFVANYNPPANKVWLNDGSGNFTDSGQNLGGSSSFVQITL